MRDDHWFVPKRYGYGADPGNWKGWACIGVWVAAIVGLSVACFVGGEPGPIGFVLFFAGMAAATITLIVIVRRKTAGDWRWRWGKEE